MYVYELFLLTPDLLLLVSTLLLFCCYLYGLATKSTFLTSYKFFFPATFLILLETLYLVCFCYHFGELLYLNSYLCSSGFVSMGKILVLFATLCWLLCIYPSFELERLPAPELFFLVLISMQSMLFLLAVNNLFLLYLAIELQSFCFYIMAGLRKNSNYSLEASLKYFILSSFSSAIFLLGIALIYGFCGQLEMYQIALLLGGENTYEFPFYLGFIFITIGLLFKLGFFPFHYWIADVYSGSPLIVTAFFSIVPKTAVVVVLLKFYSFLFLDLLLIQYFIFLVGVFSITFGSIISLYQTDILRFFAYSAITHFGFLIMGMSTYTPYGYLSVILYLLVYVISSIGFFAVLINARESKGNKLFNPYTKITQISRMSKSNIALCFSFVIILLSLGGVPPFAGFFVKFYVFVALNESGNYISLIWLLLMSVVNIVGYLRLIRFVLFVDTTVYSSSYQLKWVVAFIIAFTVLFNVFFIYFSHPLFWIVASFLISPSLVS